MFYFNFAPLFAPSILQLRRILIAAFSFIIIFGAARPGFAQSSLERVIDAPEQADILIRNPDGRVTVTASDGQSNKISIKAESPVAGMGEEDVRASTSGNLVQIEVPAHAERDRVDLTVRVPARARVRVRTVAGAVDVIGNFQEAAVETNTGTIRADVPVDALSFDFTWRASRPRYFSEVELPKIREKAGGRFEIVGRLGDKKAKKDERVHLSFVTERGVVLFGVDPSMVPADLRERALTEAARAIIKSGNEDLIDAIRRVAPHMVGDYERTLPLRGEAPTLRAVTRRADMLATPVSPRLMRLNASVTDRNGRAISGLTTGDFNVYENGQRRTVVDVEPTHAPFNLVLLLDVSGSVEERLDFIREAALAFINTVSAQDRVAIISFRDDIQLISDFTTDHRLLTERINDIQAGGATALYDALAYTLVSTIKPLRGERTAVIVLSDGDDNKSFVPFPPVLEAVIESGALIYPLYIPSGLIPAHSVAAPETTLDPMRTRYLTITSRAEEEGRKLASVSGGVYYSVTHLDALQRAYDDVVAQLRTAYTITYESKTGDAGDRGAPPEERRVSVRVNRDGASVRLSPSIGIASR